MEKDIASRQDIELLVDAFYSRVEKNELLAPLFAHVDWPKHKPVMYSFWSSMILGEQTYRGNPFAKHLPLPLSPQHFNEWLRLFEETVDTLFHGSTAAEIKQRARSIAGVWQYKLGILQEGR